ncbi:galactose-1-phosphate uridylyltransferase [Candidatus Woesearchaeota archaeon]|nr:galactose-1-phosphate uridylyltransferase [Candidatus Woesearchaeota archaeon]
MNELRKDYVLDRWVVIATGRGKRPHQFASKKEDKKIEVCFFCPGNESMTPPEIDRVEKNGSWVIRVFPNKFPAATAEGDPHVKTDNNFYSYASAYGYHEVLVESPSHEDEFGDLGIDRIVNILKMYNKRIKELSKKDGIRYVLVFKNQGREAGTSLVHTHTQIIALNKIPTLVEREAEATKDECKYCEVIESEKGSLRRIMENSFVSFAPYASRFPLEAWIFPKRHVTCLDDLNKDELQDLAQQLKLILKKLEDINAPYNFFLHYAPAGDDLHFHIEIAPRLAIWAGLEIGGDIEINIMAPEDAAKFYRGETNEEK